MILTKAFKSRKYHNIPNRYQVIILIALLFAVEGLRSTDDNTKTEKVTR